MSLEIQISMIYLSVLITRSHFPWELTHFIVNYKNCWIQVTYIIYLLTKICSFSPAKSLDWILHFLTLRIYTCLSVEHLKVFVLDGLVLFKKLCRDAWMAQRLNVGLWLRAWSWSPGIKSHIGLPVWSLLLPLPVSLPLSLCLSWINFFKKS